MHIVATLLVIVSLTLSQSAKGVLLYEEFIKLPSAERQTRFAALSAEEKAILKQTQARHWLDRNRGKLTQVQISVVNEGIAFISPELYRDPNNRTIREQEAALRRRLACILGRENAVEAFKLWPPDTHPRAKASLSTLLDSWLAWFDSCVFSIAWEQE